MIKKIKDKIKNKIFEGYRINAYLNAATVVNNRTFSKYKNCNAGKDIVMCGAGPSFSKYIPLKGVIHVALNRALLNEKIKFDYLIADDFAGLNFMMDYVEQYKCTKFFGQQIESGKDRVIPETFARKCGAERYYTDSFMVENGYKSVPVADIDCLPVGNMPNIALSALQILLFTGPRRIYLVGCDASANGHYTEKNISEKQKLEHKKDLEMAVSNDIVFDCWRNLKDFIETYYPDIEIVSINPVGLKGMFKDCYQDEEGELKYE